MAEIASRLYPQSIVESVTPSSLVTDSEDEEEEQREEEEKEEEEEMVGD